MSKVESEEKGQRKAERQRERGNRMK